MRQLIEVAQALTATQTFVSSGEHEYVPFIPMQVITVVTLRPNSDNLSMTNRAQETLALADRYAFRSVQLLHERGTTGGFSAATWKRKGLHPSGSWVVGGKPAYEAPRLTQLVITEIEAGNAIADRRGAWEVLVYDRA